MENQKSPFFKVFVGFGVFVVIVAIILVLGAVSVFAGSRDRSIAGGILDTIGLHDAALGSEFLRKDPTIITNLANYKNPSECGANWDKMSFDGDKPFAGSFSSESKITSLNPEFNQDYLKINTDLTANLRETQLAGNIKAKSQLNIDKLEEALSDDEKVKLGTINFDADVDGFVNEDAANLKINTLKLKNNDFEESGSLDNWYSQNFNLDNIQKEGVGEIANGVEELIGTNPKDVFDNEVVKAYFEMNCETLESIKVGNIEEVYFNSGNEDEYKINARVVEVVQKENSNKIVLEKTPDILEKLIKSDKFEEFLKSKYDLATKFLIAGNKIAGVENPDDQSQIFSKDQYDQAVELVLASYNKETLNELQDQVNVGEDVKVEYLEPAKYYLDNATLEPVAFTSKIKITLSESQIESMDEQFRSLIKDGIVIETAVYKLKLNEDVEVMKVPENSKEVSELQSDFESTGLFIKLQELGN